MRNTRQRISRGPRHGAQAGHASTRGTEFIGCFERNVKRTIVEFGIERIAAVRPSAEVAYLVKVRWKSANAACDLHRFSQIPWGFEVGASVAVSLREGAWQFPTKHHV